MQYDSRHFISPIRGVGVIIDPILSRSAHFQEYLLEGVDVKTRSFDLLMDKELQQDGKECNMTEGTEFHMKELCVMIYKEFCR